MNRWHLVMVMGWMVGCVAPSKEIGATVADSEEGSGTSGETAESTETSSASGMSASTTTVDPETMTSVGEVTTVGPDDTTTVGEDTTTVGPDTEGELESCEDAQTEAQCDAFPDDDTTYFTCGWVPTVVVAGGGCEVVPDTGFEGDCVQTSQDDTCGTIEDSSCTDGNTLVFYRELGLEIGAIELVAFESGICTEQADGFEPCVMIDDGENVTYEPPECACLCPA
jgi:hypothetical protein